MIWKHQVTAELQERGKNKNQDMTRYIGSHTVDVILVVVEGLGIISKCLDKWLEKPDILKRPEFIQWTVMLETAYVLRSVFQI